MIQTSSRRISARRSSLGVEGGSDMEGQNLTPTPALLYLDKGMIRARLSRLRTSLLCTLREVGIAGYSFLTSGFSPIEAFLIVSPLIGSFPIPARRNSKLCEILMGFGGAIQCTARQCQFTYIEFELKLHLASPQPLRTCWRFRMVRWRGFQRSRRKWLNPIMK